jgi:hypothetical protein
MGGGDDVMFGLVGDNPINIVTSSETSLFWVQPIGKHSLLPGGRDRLATVPLAEPVSPSL